MSKELFSATKYEWTALPPSHFNAIHANGDALKAPFKEIYLFS